jgi:hypothetical protein
MYALGNPQQCTLRDFLTAIRSGIIGGSVKRNAGYIADFGRPAATEVVTAPRRGSAAPPPPDQHANATAHRCIWRSTRRRPSAVA